MTCVGTRTDKLAMWGVSSTTHALDPLFAACLRPTHATAASNAHDIHSPHARHRATIYPAHLRTRNRNARGIINDRGGEPPSAHIVNTATAYDREYFFDRPDLNRRGFLSAYRVAAQCCELSGNPGELGSLSGERVVEYGFVRWTSAVVGLVCVSLYCKIAICQ